MPITVDSARAALSKVIDPELGRSLTEVGIAAEIAIEDGDTVSLLLALPAPGPAYRHRVEHLAREARARPERRPSRCASRPSSPRATSCPTIPARA